MRAVPSWRAAPALLCLLSLAGVQACGAVRARSVPPRPWLLSSIAPGAAANLDALPVSLGVGPVEFPEYLNRPEIVARVGANELRANEFEVWGESLRTSFRDTLSYNLSVLVPGLAVVTFPWRGAEDVDYRLAISVARFEHDVPSGAVVLEAGWVLRRSGGGPSLANKTRSFREPVAGGDAATVTAAMSRTVESLSREIAGDLTALPELRGPGP